MLESRAFTTLSHKTTTRSLDCGTGFTSERAGRYREALDCPISGKACEVAEKSVLITGGQGYLGSILTESLVADGNSVIVVDNNTVPGSRVDSPAARYVDGDVRRTEPWEPLLDEVDAVVHLAALVGDPACNVDPDEAVRTNYHGTVNVADACRHHHVAKIVFASTCSNYGRAEEGELDVWSPLNPQSTYAQSKILAEHYLLSLQGAGLTPCILRFATLHGLSPRMRFDLAVNVMTADAVRKGVVNVYGGAQWRPFLHVRDAARAIRSSLEAPGCGENPLLYNCGTSAENYQLEQVARIIAEEIPECEVVVSETDADPRDYRVNFDPIRDDLSFIGTRRIRDSIREIRDAMTTGSFEDHTEARYSNYLLARDHAPKRVSGPPELVSAAPELVSGRAGR